MIDTFYEGYDATMNPMKLTSQPFKKAVILFTSNYIVKLSKLK